MFRIFKRKKRLNRYESVNRLNNLGFYMKKCNKKMNLILSLGQDIITLYDFLLLVERNQKSDINLSLLRNCKIKQKNLNEKFIINKIE